MLNLDPEEQKLASIFKRMHKRCHSGIRTTEGDYKFSYIVTPNSFGQVLEIRCNGCGDIADITNTENW